MHADKQKRLRTLGFSVAEVIIVSLAVGFLGMSIVQKFLEFRGSDVEFLGVTNDALARVLWAGVIVVQGVAVVALMGPTNRKIMQRVAALFLVMLLPVAVAWISGADTCGCGAGEGWFEQRGAKFGFAVVRNVGLGAGLFMLGHYEQRVTSEERRENT